MKRSIRLIIILLLFCRANPVSAQERPLCGNYEHEQNQKKFNPASVKIDLANEEEIKRWVKKKSAARLTNSIITLPVVVHVIYNKAEQNISDAQIRSQIEALNQDFRRLNADTSLTPEYFRAYATDTRIQFQLARQDPNGNPTNGITRRLTRKEKFFNDDSVKFKVSGGTDIWDRDSYLNIWVCNMSSWLLGFAQSPGVGSAETDGVVINYRYFGTIDTATKPFNQGRSTTHEVGHWLNLKHIWGDAKCGDDLVEDTPIQEDSNSHCQAFPSSSCGNYSDMFMNYMDYSPDACMNLFTKGQKERMQATLNTLRQKLLSSQGAVSLNLAASDTRIFKLYPNPSAGIFYLESFLPVVSLQLKVSDTRGSIIVGREIKELTPQIVSFDLSDLANGVYHIQIITPNLSFSKRIVLVR